METGIVAAVVSAVVSILVTVIAKWHEYRAELRQRKVAQYEGFLKALIDFKVNAGDSSHVEIINENVQTMYVVGSTRTVRAMEELLDFLRSGESHGGGQDELYASLIAEMRKDLSWRARFERFPRKIRITQFA